MSVLQRVTTLIRANINDLLDRAEDPETMLKQFLADMQAQVYQVKTQVAVAIADLHQLEQQREDGSREASEWERRAGLAVDKGDDELARAALQRMNASRKVAAGFVGQIEEQRRQVDLLKDALVKLEAKLTEAEAQKDLLIARARRARAEKTVGEARSKVSDTSALHAFDRMAEKVNTLEAHAKAATELSTDSLEERFRKLEQEGDLERQLAELKKKRAGGA